MTISCECYGCTIIRHRAGIVERDRSGEACLPPEACKRHAPCWTHSEWVDEAKCDPPGACGNNLRCAAHDEVRA